MNPLLITLFALLGFIPEYATSNLHPKPSGGDSQSAVYELLAEGALWTSMKEITLTNSPLKVLIDDEDYDLVMIYRTWQFGGNNGSITHCTSFGSKETSKSISMSRLIMNAPDGVLVDHRDRNILNMRRSNLRFANKSQNGQNSGKRSVQTTSRFKGVSWDSKRNKWKSYINRFIDGKTTQVYLGRFDSEITAARMYNEAAREYFGEFACPNKI